MYYYPDELYHHGIKGQRWGKRNGPPYPLNPQTHAAVVRSSGKKGRVGGLFERQVENPSRSIRRAQEQGLMDDKTRYTKKGIKRGVKAAALTGGLGNAIGTYAGMRLTGANKKSSAIAAGAAGAAGALGGGLGAYTGGKLRNRIINKKIEKGKIRGYDEDGSARRRKIARNVAIGAGLGAAALGTAYAIKKGKAAYSAGSKGLAKAQKANQYLERANSLEAAGRSGTLANKLANKGRIATGQAKRYADVASGYARRRNLGAAGAALGLGTAGLGVRSYIRDRRRRNRNRR